MTANPDAMADVQFAAQRTPTPAEVRKTSALIVGFIALIVVAYLWAFGAPYSNWFYALLAVGILPVIYLIITGKPRNPPRSHPLVQRVAMREAVVHGIVSGLLAYAFAVTLTGMFYQWPPAVVISVIAGVQSYDAARGRKRSWRNFVIVCVVLLVVITAFVVWKTRTR